MSSLKLQWDRASAWCCVVLGLVFLAVGYAGVSGTAFTAEQIPYLASGGLGGLFFLGVGGMLWLSADLRDEWRKLDRIEAVLESQLRQAAEPTILPSDGEVAAEFAAAAVHVDQVVTRRAAPSPRTRRSKAEAGTTRRSGSG